METPAIFADLKDQHLTRHKMRGEVIGLSNQGLNLSKRAIFALHRDDIEGAKQLLAEAEERFEACEKSIAQFAGLREGAYKAAVEEYAEALLFLQYLETGTFKELPERAMRPSTYLAGLSDTTGEILRYATKHVTRGDFASAQKAEEAVSMVIEYMLELDLTGYLRTKFDQAKRNLQKLEQMMYELSLRK
jgi:predicted translin family RNA/ssDNA-binding protein